MSNYHPPFNADEMDKIIHNASPEQLAWLSGYLWAIAHKHSPLSALTDQVTTPAPYQMPITILSASQTGNARRVAQELSHDLERLGLPVRHVHAADFKFKKLHQEQYLIIVTSTQGEGEPPEEALAFYKSLFATKKPVVDQLHFAVFGLGDCSYVNFCQAGKDIDQRLEELGAKRLLARVDGDTDYQALSTIWRQNIIDELQKYLQQSPHSTALESAIKTNLVVESSQYCRDNPFTAAININQKITSRDSDRDIRHLELDLTDSNLKYQPGDALGVWYQNSASLVDELLQATKLSAQTDIELHGQVLPLKQALLEKLELTQNTPVIVEKYAKLSQNDALLTLIGDKTALRDFCHTLPIIDMVSRYAGSFTAQSFVDILRPLTPRFYSIASAQDDVGDEVHLTVNVVQYQIDDKTRTGGASGFLATQMPQHDQIKVFIEHNDNFRLPNDNSLPIIMIAAGTGIAPFRAFLQQRASEEATGQSWLFFGNPHFTADFLYQLEWQTYQKDGVLSRIDLAWSRDQAEKIYVQDKILARSAEIWQWLQAGAYIYVCGDANRMAKAVNAALLHIIMEHGQYDEEQTNNYLDELRSNKRYQRDIY